MHETLSNLIFREETAWLALFLAGSLLILFWSKVPDEIANLPDEQRLTKALNWLSRNYLWLLLTFSISAVVLAVYFFGYWQIPIITRGALNFLHDGGVDKNDAEDFRNFATGAAALLAATAVFATIPFQLIKTWMNERAAQTAEQGLITDRINKAVEQLGQEKTVTRLVFNDNGSPKLGADEKQLTRTFTEPNLEVRLGALYALERIAEDSLRDHIQIMEILCAYIRENAREPRIDLEKTKEAQSKADAELGTASPDEQPPEIKYRPLRADIQAALTILGRRKPDRLDHERDARLGQPYRLDLRNCELACQSADLSNAQLGPILLDESNLQLVDLNTFSDASLNGASC